MEGDTVADVDVHSPQQIETNIVRFDGLLDRTRVEVMYTLEGIIHQQTGEVFVPGDLKFRSEEIKERSYEHSEDNDVVTFTAVVDGDAYELTYRFEKIVESGSGETILNSHG